MRNPTSTTAEKPKVKRLTPLQSKWLRALESGEYKQCCTQLRKGNSFCCLGVACEVMGIDRSSSGYYFDNHIYSSGLPAEAMRKLRLNTNIGGLKNLVTVKGYKTDSLASLNDDVELTFPEIAAFIRANKALVFRQD